MNIDIFGWGKPNKKRYGTGMWPFTNPRPWDFNPPPGVAAIIDPAAIAAATTAAFERAGWPGLGLMEMEFQLKLIDLSEADATAEIEAWYGEHRGHVCDHVLAQLDELDVNGFSKTVKTAMEEAVHAYREGRYLTVVRVLLPEYEALARSLRPDKTKKHSQKEAIDDLKEFINNSPAAGNAIEAFTMMPFIDEHLFARCFTEADAKAFGSIPNRHAELHGFASYGDLKGATTVLVVLHFILQVLDRYKQSLPA